MEAVTPLLIMSADMICQFGTFAGGKSELWQEKGGLSSNAAGSKLLGMDEEMKEMQLGIAVTVASGGAIYVYRFVRTSSGYGYDHSVDLVESSK